MAQKQKHTNKSKKRNTRWMRKYILQNTQQDSNLVSQKGEVWRGLAHTLNRGHWLSGKEALSWKMFS